MDSQPSPAALEDQSISRGEPTQLDAEPGRGAGQSVRRHRLSERDTLTGLHGQRYLCRAVDECLRQSRRRGLTASLALLQLENFYEIRSWVGASEADQLLTDIAQLLKKALPKRVLLCRCHNYEFAALLVGDRSVNAGLITDKLKQALLSAVSPVLPRQLELKCGVGLASLDSNIPSWSVVFARARHNLGLRHHHSELPAHLAATALKQLHAALICKGLELNFQAWAHFREGSCRHYEVRCSLSDKESRLPTVLLFETAARNALGEQLDRRIIEQVIARLAGCVDARLRLVVNLSHNSVVSVPFLHWLETRLADSQTLAARLVFQISEIDALIAQHHLANFFGVVQTLGCLISISNFGCTPNPLRYLSLVPASYVKLDSAMLSDIDVNIGKLECLNSLSAELHTRQIAVVAPMLERLSNLPLLWQARVDYLQGNCLHTPGTSMDYEFLKTQTLSFD